MGLLELIHDLTHDSDVRKRFNTNPDHVAVKEYGLDSLALGALYTMNPGKIADAIGSQLAAYDYMFMDGEFASCGHLHQPPPTPPGGGGGMAQAQYPAPTPEIFRIAPSKWSLADGDFELCIYGQSFSPDARIDLIPTAGGANLTVTGGKVFGTFRCAEAYGVVAPAKGTYDVMVVNAPTSPTPTKIKAPMQLVIA